MSAQREHDYFAETVICANCYIVALFFLRQKTKKSVLNQKLPRKTKITPTGILNYLRCCTDGFTRLCHASTQLRIFFAPCLRRCTK